MVPSLDRRMGLNLAVSHGHQPASNLLPTVWKPSPAAVAAAAANGHLAVLQWLHSRKTPMPSILSALNSGQATIVTFLADHHRVSAEDVMTAVRTGQLALVQALGSTPGKPHLLLAEACRMGYLELAKYFVQQGAVLTNQADACVFGSTHLARAVLPPESLHHCRMPFLRRNVLVGRAPLRPFELVELCKRGCSVLSVLPGWRKSPECAAALGSNGHVELVQRLDESVQPAAFEAAAANGHLSCLRFEATSFAAQQHGERRVRGPHHGDGVLASNVSRRVPIVGPCEGVGTVRGSTTGSGLVRSQIIGKKIFSM